MTDKQLMQEVDSNIEIAKSSLVEATKAAKEIKESMESRVHKVINRMFEISSSPEAAVELILSMGYSKEEICECGYDVDALGIK